MANQSITRREALELIGLAMVAARFGGFERWAFAYDESPVDHCTSASGRRPARAARYAPRFFKPAEYATVARLAELIIPTDDTPGAKEAGVSEFIDTLAHADIKLQPQYRDGLRWLDAHARLHQRKPFLQLDPQKQNDILEHLAYRSKFRAGEEKGREFFALVRRHVVMGYYTSRPGLEALGFPGLKQFWTAMPECPHPGDPEHRHLPKEGSA